MTHFSYVPGSIGTGSNLKKSIESAFLEAPLFQNYSTEFLNTSAVSYDY